MADTPNNNIGDVLFKADVLIDRFRCGVSVEKLAKQFQTTEQDIEKVIRWFLLNVYKDTEG